MADYLLFRALYKFALIIFIINIFVFHKVQINTTLFLQIWLHLYGTAVELLLLVLLLSPSVIIWQALQISDIEFKIYDFVNKSQAKDLSMRKSTKTSSGEIRIGETFLGIHGKHSNEQT